MLLSTSSQYAITGILRLAVLPADGFCRIDDLVRGTHAPRHAVAKVFYELSKRRILQSVRGIGGGYRPCPGIGDLTLMEIIETLDGPYNAAALTERGLCGDGPVGPLEVLLQPVSDRLEQILRTTRVRDLIAPQAPLRCCPTCDAGETNEPHIGPVNRSATGEGAST